MFVNRPPSPYSHIAAIDMIESLVEVPIVTVCSAQIPLPIPLPVFPCGMPIYSLPGQLGRTI